MYTRVRSGIESPSLIALLTLSRIAWRCKRAMVSLLLPLVVLSFTMKSTVWIPLSRLSPITICSNPETDSAVSIISHVICTSNLRDFNGAIVYGAANRFASVFRNHACSGVCRPCLWALLSKGLKVDRVGHFGYNTTDVRTLRNLGKMSRRRGGSQSSGRWKGSAGSGGPTFSKKTSTLPYKTDRVSVCSALLTARIVGRP